MKKIMIITTVLFAFNLLGQVKGDIAKDQRELLTETNFIKEGKVNGRLVYDIAIDSKGEITGIKLNEEESSVKNTPLDIKTRNYVKTFKFQEGTHFPKHHQGQVIITIVKPK